MSMTFATDVIVSSGNSMQTNKILAPTTAGGDTYGAGSSGQVLKSNGTNAYWADASPASLVITTTNSSASDALTYDSAVTLVSGQLVFITLNKAMSGSSYATIKFGSASAINLYLTSTTQLKAAYTAGSVLAFAYINSKLVMINPPVAV